MYDIRLSPISNKNFKNTFIRKIFSEEMLDLLSPLKEVYDSYTCNQLESLTHPLGK